MITPLEPERRAGLPQPESPIDGVVVGVVLRGLVGGATMSEKSTMVHIVRMWKALHINFVL